VVAGQEVVGGPRDGVADGAEAVARPAQDDAFTVDGQIGVGHRVGHRGAELPPLGVGEGTPVRDRGEARLDDAAEPPELP